MRRRWSSLFSGLPSFRAFFVSPRELLSCRGAPPFALLWLLPFLCDTWE
jgi:hypothetical protein